MDTTTSPVPVTAVAEDSRSALEVLLNPKSVAMIGASTNPESLGGRPLGFMMSYGYAGNVYPVNSKSDVVQGLAAFKSILDVPEQVDLALIAVRAELVPQILRECSDSGVQVAVVMSSGFGEGTGGGADLAEVIRTQLRSTDMRILGPNCEGLASLPAFAPLTFSPVLDIRRTGNTLKRGGIAIVSQSGGLGFAVAGWGTEVGLGYNYIVTTGNELDIDALEVAQELAEDSETSALVLIVESFEDGPAFRAIAQRYADAGKYLIMAKLGQSPAGARGALAHTSHVAGDPVEYSELFNRPGVLQVSDNDELIDVLQSTTKIGRLAGARVGIVSTSGGAGVWLADACVAEGLTVPELTPATKESLRAYMPVFGSPANPVDLTAQFLSGGSFVPPIRALVDSGEVDLVILTTSLSSAGRLNGDREALAALVAESPVPIAIYSYTKPAPSCVDILNELNVPWYTSSTRAARALAAITPRSNS